MIRKMWILYSFTNQLLLLVAAALYKQQILSANIRVIPCPIPEELQGPPQILTKLGVFGIPMVLITHTDF